MKPPRRKFPSALFYRLSVCDRHGWPLNLYGAEAEAFAYWEATGRYVRDDSPHAAGDDFERRAQFRYNGRRKRDALTLSAARR